MDWFWRGWFYTTDHVDIALQDVQWMRLNTKNPDKESAFLKGKRDEVPTGISSIRNAKEIEKTQDEIDPSLRDFYTDYDPLNVTILDQDRFKKYYNNLSEKERSFMDKGYNFYELTFESMGGMLMPIILQFDFVDGSQEIHRIPAEIWRLEQHKVSKVFVTEKEIQQIILDPYLETADVDRSNNYYPPRQEQNRFELFKQRQRGENPMQRAKRAKAMEGTN
ncbi:MAG: hypothetical protein AAFV25_28070 [Bacteroidota bacterium]